MAWLGSAHYVLLQNRVVWYSSWVVPGLYFPCECPKVVWMRAGGPKYAREQAVWKQACAMIHFSLLTYTEPYGAFELDKRRPCQVWPGAEKPAEEWPHLPLSAYPYNIWLTASVPWHILSWHGKKASPRPGSWKTQGMIRLTLHDSYPLNEQKMLSRHALALRGA